MTELWYYFYLSILLVSFPFLYHASFRNLDGGVYLLYLSFEGYIA